MSDGPMQPDETAFPETQDTLSLLASSALPAEARARHLHAIRMRAAELGPPAGEREARTLSPAPLREGLRWRGRRAAAVAGVWMGTLSLGTGVAAASAMDDLPGQPLYGLKRAVEAVQLHLPGDTQDDVRRRLELAARRLAEAEALHANGADATLLADTLTDAQTLIDDAGELAEGDAALTSTVAGSASQARVRLAELLSGGLPEQAADRAREAIEAATERAEARESERAEDAEDRGRGRGRGGEQGRAAAPATTGPSEREDDEDDDRRGRGRGDDEDRAAAPASPDRGGTAPSEADDDDDAPSGKGRSSHESDDDDDEDDESADSRGNGSGSGSGASQGQSASQGNAGQGGGRGGRADG